MKSVEGEADQQTPVESTDLTQSNAELSERGGEDKPDELKAEDGDAEHEVNSISAGVEEQRETSKASRKTLIKKKKKKQKDPAVDEPEPSANGDAHQELEVQEVPAHSTAGNMKRKKKQKQKSGPAEQILPGKKRRVKDEDVKVNGHAGETSGKRQKLIGVSLSGSLIYMFTASVSL